MAVVYGVVSMCMCMGGWVCVRFIIAVYVRICTLFIAFNV